MAIRNNDSRYSVPVGMTRQEQNNILHEILNILQQREPVGGWKSSHPSSEDLDALQEVVNYFNSKGLTS